jgi:ubiquinone/menaquinone biosynthesis C-methylase UbiE
MALQWTPARRRGVEVLDDPTTSAEVRESAMNDVARSNTLFGGTRAVLSALQELLPQLPRDISLLDVGTGTADIPERVASLAKSRGHAVRATGLDVSEDLAAIAKAKIGSALTGDARRLPLSDASVDIVTCSQLLHHFEDADARTVISELHRVARRAVIIADLRRSHLAATAFGLASVALRFHPVTRADGITSVYRGFTARELTQLVHDATGAQPRVRNGAFWRLSASWTKKAR